MSTRTAYVVTCDHRSGCSAEYVTGSEVASAARSAARDSQWGQRRVVKGTSVRWEDLCPDHKGEQS